jgi:hypothetical protein
MADLQKWRYWRQMLLLLPLLFCVVVMSRTTMLSQSQRITIASLNMDKETVTVVVRNHLSIFSLLQEEQSKDNNDRHETHFHFEVDEKICHSSSIGNYLAFLYT